MVKSALLIYLTNSQSLAQSPDDCGDCWQADANGNCVPEVRRVTTICGPDSIQMTIEACVFNGKYDNEAVFVGSDNTDSNCKLSFDGQGYSLEHGLSDCGMNMVLDSENGSIIFQVSSEQHTATCINTFHSRIK